MIQHILYYTSRSIEFTFETDFEFRLIVNDYIDSSLLLTMLNDKNVKKEIRRGGPFTIKELFTFNKVMEVELIQIDEFKRIVASLIKYRPLQKKEERLSIDEACQFIGVSDVTLLNLRNEGKIKSILVGKRPFFLKSELEDYLDFTTRY